MRNKNLNSHDHIPITKPFLGKEEMEAIIKPLETGWIVQGPHVEEFEQKFNLFTGVKNSIASTSCTTALHMGIKALGIKPGDEVIVPAFTWVSTANVVEYEGGTPVFCDIDLDTFNITVQSIEQLITERTVGIIPVHLFGLCADMDPIIALAEKHDVWVMEDAACAFGAIYKGNHAGTCGKIGCFSFHPRKSITTGEGGMVTTQDDNLADVIRSLRDHGATKTDLTRHEEEGAYLLSSYPMLGFNYRMTDFQGAVGSAQMNKAEFILDKRKIQAEVYDKELQSSYNLKIPYVPEGYIHGYQAYVTLFCDEEPNLGNVDQMNQRRNLLMAELETLGISTRQGTHSAALTQFYTQKYGTSREAFPNSYIAEKLTLSLPLFTDMSELQQEYIIKTVLSKVNQ